MRIAFCRGVQRIRHLPTPGHPQAFDTHMVSYRNITTQRTLLEKQANWPICQGQEKIVKGCNGIFTRDDVVSLRLKIRQRIPFVFLGVKLPCFFNFPLTFPYAKPVMKKLWFLLAATLNHVEVRLDCTSGIKDTASAKKGKVSLLLSWFTVKKLECLEFITYEVVARLVASQPKKNAPLAKKLWGRLVSV